MNKEFFFRRYKIENNNQKELKNEGLLLFKNCNELLKEFGEAEDFHREVYSKKDSIGMHVEPLRRWKTPEVEVKKDNKIFKASIISRDFGLWTELDLDVLTKSEEKSKKFLINEGLDELFISCSFSDKLGETNKLLYLNEKGESTFGDMNGRVPSLKELKDYKDLCKVMGKKLAEILIKNCAGDVD